MFSFEQFSRVETKLQTYFSTCPIKTCSLTWSTYRHYYGSDVSPCGDPVETRLVAGHLLDARREPPHAKDPPNGDRLEEAAPQDWDAARAVEGREGWNRWNRRN